MPTFVPKPEAAGRALIELHKGDLTLANLSFSSEGATRPRHWVLVEDSLLAIRHCRFRDPAPNAGASTSDVGASIAFIARGTAPIPPRVGPFEKETDRPSARLKNCVIWTAGEAISAEVGRGVIDLENCLILSGGPAVTLLPQQVDRDKFEADLVMERCTIAVEDRTECPARPPGRRPDGSVPPLARLVPTMRLPPDADGRGTGRVAPGRRRRDGPGRPVLAVDIRRLRGQPPFPGLPIGALQPADIPPADLKKQWTDLWGAHHTRGDQGPIARRSSDTFIRYKERPKPGRVTPTSLELDTQAQKDMGVDFKNLPLDPTRGVTDRDDLGLRGEYRPVEPPIVHGSSVMMADPIDFELHPIHEDEPPWFPPRTSSAGWSSRSTAPRT